jgi:hypothetical protein
MFSRERLEGFSRVFSGECKLRVQAPTEAEPDTGGRTSPTHEPFDPFPKNEREHFFMRSHSLSEVTTLAWLVEKA